MLLLERKKQASARMLPFLHGGTLGNSIFMEKAVDYIIPSVLKPCPPRHSEDLSRFREAYV